jgi:hypothetical protein
MTPSNLIFATKCPRLDKGGIRAIRKLLKAHPYIRLIIIDTLAMVRPAERPGSIYAQDYAAIALLKALADEFDIAILVIHHIRKQTADDPMERISGSTGLSGAVDGWLIMDRERGDHDVVLHVTGRDIEIDDALALKWDKESARFAVLGSAERFANTKIRAAILKVFEQSEKVELTIKEVREALQRTHPETNYDQVKQRMFQMGKDGELKQGHKGGPYSLPAMPRGTLT